MNSIRWGAALLWLAACCSACAATSAAVPHEKDGTVVVLPNYVVTETADLPPPEAWLYARVPGFEVLSSAGNRRTRELVRDLQEFAGALDVVWPTLRPREIAPTLLILCGRPGEFRQFSGGGNSDRDFVVQQARDGAWGTLVIDLARSERDLPAVGLPPETGAVAAEADDELLPAQDSAADEPVRGEIDHEKQVRRAFVKLLLSHTEPPFPAWFEEGLAQLFAPMRITPKLITYGKIDDPNLVTDGPEDNDFSVALKRRALLGFDDFFLARRTADAPQQRLGSVWAKQAQAFVHFCFYNRRRDRQRELLAFAEACRQTPPTPATFRAAFGTDYEAMLAQLRTYASFGRYRYFEFRAEPGKSLPAPAPVELHEATPGDVGRLKAAALRLAGQAPAARAAAGMAWRRGERGPALMTELGLAERGLGHPDVALQWLEQAIAAGSDDPRAYVGAAELRLAIFRTGEAKGARAVAPGEAARVLPLLRRAQELTPRMAESYAMVAALWVEQDVPPPHAELTALAEGVSRLPHQRDLAFNVARLFLRSGWLAEAHVLIDRGMRTAMKTTERDRWKNLRPTAAAKP